MIVAFTMKASTIISPLPQDPDQERMRSRSEVPAVFVRKPWTMEELPCTFQLWWIVLRDSMPLQREWRILRQNPLSRLLRPTLEDEIPKEGSFGHCCNPNHLKIIEKLPLQTMTHLYIHLIIQRGGNILPRQGASSWKNGSLMDIAIF